MKHEDFMKYEEKKGHGTYMLPFAAYGTLIPENLKFFPAHWHDEMEIVYVKRGHCTYYVNFKPYDVNEGDVLIIPPTVIHSFEQYKDEEFVGFAAVFSLNIINNNSLDVCSSKYFMPVFNNEITFPVHIKKGEKNCEKIRNIVWRFLRCYYEKNECYELRLKMHLLELFVFMFEHRMFSDVGRKAALIRNSEKTKVIISYIEQHYSEKITLEDLAENTNQSVYNLAHSFKACTGQSPLEYIKQYRLSIAAKQLEITSNQIISIAIDNGFNNVSYFNRAFREKFGMTPTEYRRSCSLSNDN